MRPFLADLKEYTVHVHELFAVTLILRNQHFTHSHMSFVHVHTLLHHVFGTLHLNIAYHVLDVPRTQTTTYGDRMLCVWPKIMELFPSELKLAKSLLSLKTKL